VKPSYNIPKSADYEFAAVTQSHLAQILNLDHTGLPIHKAIATGDWRVKQRETLQLAYNQNIKTRRGNDLLGRPGRRR